jgi:hypothetical protein
MSTSFILRSPYLPANRSVYRLDAPSPLAWFQWIWPRLHSDTSTTSKMLLDAEGLYGFASFAGRVRSEGLAAPATYDELQQLLSENWYSSNVECRDGYVLVETDDDEVELAFWWLSDELFVDGQERFACYATDPLPLEIGSGGFDPGCDITVCNNGGGDGAVFCVFVTVWDGGNLTESLSEPREVRGIRLPGLADWLRAAPPGKITPTELNWLALVARHNPELDLEAVLRRLAEVPSEKLGKHWKAFTDGTLTEDELRRDIRWLGPGAPAVLLHGNENSMEFRFYDGFNWHVWFLFDDLWASAHPTLARSLLRFGMPISE